MSDFWDDDDSFDTSDTGGSSGNDDFFGNNNAGSGQDFFADNNSGGQDFFGNDSSGSDDFFGNNGSNGDDFFAQNSRPNNQQPQPQNESPKPPIKTNFSSKMIGLILIGIVLLVALVLVIFNNIHITKKEEGTTTNSTQKTTQAQQQQPNQPQVSDSDMLLYSVPDSVTLDYSQIQVATGQVVGKPKYLYRLGGNNNQVIYDVQISMTAGVDRITVNFLCPYSVYNEVKTGDYIQVFYYVVQDGYFSVLKIEKAQ